MCVERSIPRRRPILECPATCEKDHRHKVHVESVDVLSPCPTRHGRKRHGCDGVAAAPQAPLMASLEESAAAGHRNVLRLMQARDLPAARRACEELNARHPGFAAGWVCASQIAMAQKAPQDALAAIDRALGVDAHNPRYLLHRAQCLLSLARRTEALEAADAAARGAGTDAAVWDGIGTLRSYAGDQSGALAAYDRAAELAPGNPGFIYNRASVRRFLGDLAGAEADYDRVIALRPLGLRSLLEPLGVARAERGAQPRRGTGGLAAASAARLARRGADPLTHWPRNARTWASTPARSNSCAAARNGGANT